MSKITKQLKNIGFEYDEENKIFSIIQSENRIELNKVYAFAFMRFVVRMAQRNWLRPKRLIKKTEKTLNDLDVENIENPDQLKMFE